MSEKGDRFILIFMKLHKMDKNKSVPFFVFFVIFLFAAIRTVSAEPLKSYSTKIIRIGEWKVSLKGQLGWIDGVFDINGNYSSLLDSSSSYREWNILLYLRTGLVEDIEIGFRLPYAINRFKINENRQSGNGIGDFSVVFRDTFTEESQSELGISVLFEFKFPTGKYKDLNVSKLGADKTGTGSSDMTFMFLLEKRISDFVIYLNFGASHSSEYSEDINGISTGVINPEKLLASLSLEYFFSESINGLFEINALASTKKKINEIVQDGTDVSLLELTGGAIFNLSQKTNVLVGSSLAIFGKNTNASITPMVEIRTQW